MSEVCKIQPRRPFRGRLLGSTATAVCGVGLFASPALADTIPPECDVVGNEVTCVVPAPDSVDQIYTSFDGAYVKIGNADTPTAVITDAGDAVIMTGGDQLALQVADGSSVTSTQSIGALLSSDPGTNIFVLGNGDFSGSTDGFRIFEGAGSTLQLLAHDITGVSGTGLAIDALGGNGSNILNVSGTIAGAVDGVNIADTSDSAIFAGFNNIDGGNDGLAIDKSGTGTVNIDIAGNVVGAAHDGINLNRTGDGDTSVNTHGDITGGLNAVWIEQDGEGDVTFVNEGTITGKVDIRSYASTGAVLGIVNEVAGDNLVSARVNEPGSDASVTLIATGTVNGHLRAVAQNGDVAITTQAVNTAVATMAAVYAISDGTGDVSIISEGDVTANDAGILVYNNLGGNTAIESEGVSSAESTGIFARHEAASPGDIAILAHGQIASAEEAIWASHHADGDVDVTAEGAIDAGTSGIKVTHHGDGNVVVDAQGDITSQGQGVIVERGVNVPTFGDGDITIATGAVDAAQSGVVALHEGNGDIAIDATGPITAGDDGVFVAAKEATGNVTVHTADTVDAATNFGISVVKYTAGDVSVVADEAVSGGKAAINVESYNVGNVSIQSNADLGGSLGALANGNIDVEVNGSIAARDGIDDALLIRATGDVTTRAEVLVSGDITGTYDGILAEGLAGAAVALDVGGTVSGTHNGANITASSVDLTLNAVEAGEIAVNLVSFTDANVTIGSATGGTYGLLAEAEGNLTLDIGDAIGTSQSGVEAYVADDIDVTVRGHVSGSDAGIRAYGVNPGQVWNFNIEDGALVESSTGFAFEMNALGGTGQLTLVNRGTIDGASGSGVFLSNSADGDRFDNYGLVTGAISPGQGDDVIVNAGTIEGTFWDVGGDDTFLNTGIFRGAISDLDGMTVGNAEGGLFEVIYPLGLDLGGGTMNNAGTFSSGGADNIFTTDVNGSFVQVASGTMLVDVDSAAGTADRLDIVGDATLAGSVNVNFGTPTASQQEFLIVSTGGGTLVDNGLTLGGQIPLSPLVTLGLDFRTDKELYLTSLVDFTPDGANLNPNQEEIADEIDVVFGNDPNALGDLNDGLFELDNLDDYADALNQLVPEIYLNTQQTSLLAAQDFSSELGGCSGRDGRMLADGKGCAKLLIGGDLFDREGSFEQIGFNDGTLKLQADYFVPLGEALTLAVGVGYDDTLVKNDIASKAQGHRFQVGANLTYRSGGFALGGTVSAGFTNYDVTRRIAFGNFVSQSEGNQKLRALTGELSASYTADLGGAYIKPAASFVATNLHSNDLVETGGVDTDYAIDGSTDWHLAARPSIEIGGDFTSGNGLRIQPYVRGGATVLFDEDFALTGQFADANNLGDGFMTTSELDRTTVDLDAGVRFLIGKNSALNAEYVGRYSDAQSSHGFRVRASFAF